MRILVTGAAGYWGSALVPALIRAGHQVTAVDIQPCPAWLDLPYLDYLQSDVREPALFQKAVKNSDVWILLAALVGAPACGQYPVRARQVNVESVQKMLAFKHPDQRVIFPMTNNIYAPGSGQSVCDEDAPVRALSLYSQTKQQAETAVLAQPNTVSLRLASLFGASPAMRWDLMVHDFVKSTVQTGVLKLFESGYKRNFIHIQDAVDGVLFAIRHFAVMSGKIFNLAGADCNLTKHELALAVQKVRPGLKVECGESQKDPDQRDFFISTARLGALGFKAQRTVQDALPELIKTAEQSLKEAAYAG